MALWKARFHRLVRQPSQDRKSASPPPCSLSSVSLSVRCVSLSRHPLPPPRPPLLVSWFAFHPRRRKALPGTQKQAVGRRKQTKGNVGLRRRRKKRKKKNSHVCLTLGNKTWPIKVCSCLSELSSFCFVVVVVVAFFDSLCQLGKRPRAPPTKGKGEPFTASASHLK